MTRIDRILPLFTATLALLATACGAPQQVKPEPVETGASTAQPTPTAEPVRVETVPVEGSALPPRAATAVRFEVTAFATADGAAPAERLIPAGGDRTQFWPGNAGDVIERQIGDVTHVLAGDALSTGWSFDDLGALSAAGQLALRVVSIEKAPDKLVESTHTGTFAPTPVAAETLPEGGTWYRIRFFPAGVWKEAQLQGYVQVTDKQAQWYRVGGLIRGLYGPQNRGYQKGDLFEFRATARPSGIKLHPMSR